MIEAQVVDMDALRAVCIQGCPDLQQGTRADAWKLLLGYLPPDRRRHRAKLITYRATYTQFLHELVPGNRDAADPFVTFHELLELATSDTDKDIMGIIDKDVVRTRAGMHFFVSRPDDKPNVHQDALARMLFLFAKLHPAMGYVQGMNEILAPIYYCFVTDSDGQGIWKSEIDAFFCFDMLIADIQNWYSKELDSSCVGLHSNFEVLDQLLSILDPQLYCHFMVNEVPSKFYALSWLTTLLARQFTLPDVMRLWDSLFSTDHRYAFLIHCCCAMVVFRANRKRLLEMDSFPYLLSEVQKNPYELGVEPIIKTAQRLLNISRRKGIAIDSQSTLSASCDRILNKSSVFSGFKSRLSSFSSKVRSMSDFSFTSEDDDDMFTRDFEYLEDYKIDFNVMPYDDFYDDEDEMDAESLTESNSMSNRIMLDSIPDSVSVMLKLSYDDYDETSFPTVEVVVNVLGNDC